MKNLVIYFLIFGAIYAYYRSTQAERDDSGVVVSEGVISAFQMAVGDCFDDEESDPDSEEGVTEITEVPGVPCSVPHDNEVFALYDLALAEFPTDGSISETAFDGCLDYFEGYVGRDYQTSALDIIPIYPTLTSWTENNDREVICTLYDLDLNKLEGSVQGMGL